jgi:hypothetical protein
MAGLETATVILSEAKDVCTAWTNAKILPGDTCRDQGQSALEP